VEDSSVDDSRIVHFDEKGKAVIAINSPAETRQALKELRIKKKEPQLENRAISAELAEIRARRRLEVGQQGSMFRSGEELGKLFRALERSSRDRARAKHSEAVAACDQKKTRLDSRIQGIDRAIAQTEAYALANPEPKRSPHSRQASATGCAECGGTNDPSERFCGTYGKPLQ